MVNCENCGEEQGQKYCASCVRVMQAEARVHADSADAERFEVELDFEPALDSDEGDGYPNDAEGYEYPEFDE